MKNKNLRSNRFVEALVDLLEMLDRRKQKFQPSAKVVQTDADGRSHTKPPAQCSVSEVRNE